MKVSIPVGKTGTAVLKVQGAHTALAMGSGGVEVLATPMLVALMEMAAVEALKEEEGLETVGTRLDIRHLAATPVGMTITAKAQLIQIQKDQLIFQVEAWDEEEKVGEGHHHRFMIKKERFMKKVRAKGQGFREG